MTIETKNLIIASHLPRHLRALLHGPEEFYNVAGLRVADGVREQFLSATSDFLKSLEDAYYRSKVLSKDQYAGVIRLL